MTTLRGRFSLSRVVLLLAFALVVTGPREGRANDGVLDPTCGTGGKVTADYFGSQNNQAVATAVQADGKIVVGGWTAGATNDWILMRYNADGSPDASFGSGGTVTTDFAGDDDRLTALAIQSDGKIVAAGFAVVYSLTTRDFALARYNADGSLDDSFGNHGKMVIDLYGRNDTINAMVIQGDGKIVVGGTTRNPNLQQTQFAIARYNADGGLDQAFGVYGIVSTTVFGLDDEILAVALQTDGKIVVAGYTLIGGVNYDFALARYDGTDGSLDASFGTGGIVMTDFASADDTAFALAIQSDGKIVAAGHALNAASGYDFALARYNAADGSPDSSFGIGGKVTTDFFGKVDQIGALFVQPNGRLLAAGRAVNGAGDLDMALARYQAADGSLDTSFGSAGKLTTDFAGGTDAANAAAMLAGGKILAVGFAWNPATGRDFALVRYLVDGTVDTTFGTAGTTAADLVGSTPNEIHALAVQPDGKIVAAGVTPQSGNGDFALTRFNPNGSLDSSFGAGGMTLTDIGGSIDIANGVVLQSDGKIVAGGVALDTASAFVDFALCRYLANGTLDAAWGSGGKVLTSIQQSDDEIEAIALQPDGKLVAAGYSFAPLTGAFSFALARYDTSGNLDPAFGTGGTVVTSFFGVEDEALAVAIQADEKIVAAGHAVDAGVIKFALARYNVDGSLDASFGEGGKVTTSFFDPFIDSDDEAFAVAIQADQKIVVAGYTTYFGARFFALARYKADGTLDAGFGTGGLSWLEILGNDQAFAIAMTSDQKIVLTGYATSIARQFAVARWNPDLEVDSTFGTGGSATTTLGDIDDEARAIVLEPDGRIVAGGFTAQGATGRDFALVRYFVCGFKDIEGNQFHEDICSVAQAGITAGCGSGNYCPDSSVTRAQMAVFLLKAEHGIDYVPPACTNLFPDVPCPSLFADWIVQLATEGITAGCGGGNYCPDQAVTRAQMAAFLLKTEHGTGYTPPTCNSIFGDVTCPSQFADWIEALYGEGVTGGCQASPLLYCPDNPNTRGQMAVFLTKAFGLALY